MGTERLSLSGNRRVKVFVDEIFEAHFKVALTREIVRLGGQQTEGIFRLAGELDKVYTSLNLIILLILKNFRV